MKLIVCIDNQYGMSFNKRRQSQDRILRNKIIELCHHHILWMNTYSSKQFENGIDDIIRLMNQYQCEIKVNDDFLDYIQDDYCFIENINITDDIINKSDKLILLCWNRDYPSDTFFNKSYLNQYSLIKSEDIKGFSHETITILTYNKY